MSAKREFLDRKDSSLRLFKLEEPGQPSLKALLIIWFSIFVRHTASTLTGAQGGHGGQGAALPLLQVVWAPAGGAGARASGPEGSEVAPAWGWSVRPGILQAVAGFGAGVSAREGQGAGRAAVDRSLNRHPRTFFLCWRSPRPA